MTAPTTSSKARQRRLAVWNQAPITCAGPCRRSWEPRQIRIVFHQRAWWCQRCADEATRRVRANAGTIIRSSATDPTWPTGCATCTLPITGRRVINARGEHVHYRCPRRKVAS